MGDFAVNVIHSTPGILLIVIRGFSVFLFSLGVVYILGRMLEILREYRTKNFIALICMFASSYTISLIYDVPEELFHLELYARIAMYITIAAIFYVLIGFDLYDRFNSWSDRKFGTPVVKPKPRVQRKPKA